MQYRDDQPNVNAFNFAVNSVFTASSLTPANNGPTPPLNFLLLDGTDFLLLDNTNLLLLGN